MVATGCAVQDVAGIAWRARLTDSRKRTRGGTDLLRLDRTLSGSAFALYAPRPLLGGQATLALSSPLRLYRARKWDMELGWSAALGTRELLRLGVAHAIDAGHVAGAHGSAGFVALTLK